MDHRAELKVYMSHTDLWRIQEAAKITGRSLSGYMKWSALLYADALNIPTRGSLMSRILKGQLELDVVPEEESK